MEQYLIDTNAVSDYFSSSFSPQGMSLLDVAINSIPNISIITQIELLCWKTDTVTEQNIKSFISDSKILDLSPEVISHCVNIHRVKRIKTPDAIIAATALAFGFVIITANKKDFGNISGLKIINPHDI